MSGFDIKTLLEFQPPQWHCERCLGLFNRKTLPRHDWNFKENPKCLVCGVQYIPDAFKAWQVADYLKACNYDIKIRDTVSHAKQLARIAGDMATGSYTGSAFDFPNFDSYSAFEALLEAIRQAEAFIHFTSVGISRLVLGALLLAAQRVQVRGIVSNIDEPMQAELTQLNREARGLFIKTFGKNSTWREMPHQKLVVIDGLLAFKARRICQKRHSGR